MTTKTIKDWAEDDRPREKLISKGPSALSHAELLAILIVNGYKSQSALDIAKEIMASVNNDLEDLGRITLKELQKTKGIGQAKAVTIAAALELGRRRQQGDENAIKNKNFIHRSADIANYLKTKFQDLDHEIFGVLFLNRANKVIGFEIVSEGGYTGTVADPKKILKAAIEIKATGIVLTHNHPSGNLKPSQSDKNLTDKIKNAASFLDISLLDHIIVSNQGYFSFADEGLL